MEFNTYPECTEIDDHYDSYTIYTVSWTYTDFDGLGSGTDYNEQIFTSYEEADELFQTLLSQTSCSWVDEDGYNISWQRSDIRIIIEDYAP